MKMIKKYWAVIVGMIIMIITLGTITKKVSDTKTKKFDDAIDDNENEVAKLQGKVEVIEEQRVEVKTEIVTEKKVIEDLKQQKETIKPASRPTAAAKQNILNKTARNKKTK